MAVVDTGSSSGIVARSTWTIEVKFPFVRSLVGGPPNSQDSNLMSDSYRDNQYSLANPVKHRGGIHYSEEQRGDP